MAKSAEVVRAWEDQVILPTYPEQPPDKNPMFLEKRVYQGSSGKVYPRPFTDRVASEKAEKTYNAVFLENRYIHLMLLPEIGGRIHIGRDRTNGYDFFYRQTVIKPALVGLLGPWISGGVEFNWPQHHRPSTYMPVEHEIERHPDGSATVWLGEQEPLERMKGMVGICLHPSRAYVEAKVRLYNRTPFAQTFLWWANVGVHVHDEYQAFFPPDVAYVADHAKRAVSSYPVARNFYYGVDYRQGVDISWYKNIPVPTSYMVMESKYDFFGGYDHKRKAGLVHVANHHIAPGKKLWTWGNAEFGYAWDRNLTDSDGPYVELMAGVYTDNQPDFSWLEPYETRSWSQFWYPIQEMGPAKNANRSLAVNFEQSGKDLKVGVCATEPLPGASVVIALEGGSLREEKVDLAPAKPFLRRFPDVHGTALKVLGSDGREIIRYAPESLPAETSLPEPASEPPEPKDIPSNDELYLTGLHLEQYRHATRYPEPYWLEALCRDPLDSRSNRELGLLKLRRGQFAEAETYLRRAVERLTRRNPNPSDGSAHYYLGLALEYEDRREEAYAAYHKAVWNYAWQSPGYYRLAAIDCRRKNFDAALEHLNRSLETNRNQSNARNLKATILRRQGREEEALALVLENLAADPLDCWSKNELMLLSRLGASGPKGQGREFPMANAQLCLDLAFDYAAAGFWDDAGRVFEPITRGQAGVYPMVLYALGDFAARQGDSSEAAEYREAASKASPDYCFPSRLEEAAVLESALRANPGDAKAHYYLGNFLCDKKRREEAIREWERSVELDSSFSIPWRNLGIQYFNLRKNEQSALTAYERAFFANPGDARLLYELDQLRKRIGFSAAERLAFLEQYPGLVEIRDDLAVEVITLLNQSGESERALEMLGCRRFHPWEGGEGLVSGQYVWAHLLLGRAALESGRPKAALSHFAAAREYPHNLGEGKHRLTPENHLDYFTGVSLSQLGRQTEAREYWNKGLDAVEPVTWMTYYRALSFGALGRASEMNETLAAMRAFASRQMLAEVKIDYFATSLPNFLLFEDDLQKRNQTSCRFILALAELGEGKTESAERRLKQVLAADPNHLGAIQELRSLGQAPRGERPGLAASLPAPEISE